MGQCMAKDFGYMRMIRALALGAQRCNFPLPRPIRRALRAMLRRVTESQAAGVELQDWSTPLVARTSDVTVNPTRYEYLENQPKFSSLINEPVAATVPSS